MNRSFSQLFYSDSTLAQGSP